jgi:hypothetical protein
MATLIDVRKAGSQYLGSFGIPETLYLRLCTACAANHAATQEGKEIRMDG